MIPGAVVDHGKGSSGCFVGKVQGVAAYGHLHQTATVVHIVVGGAEVITDPGGCDSIAPAIAYVCGYLVHHTSAVILRKQS